MAIHLPPYNLDLTFLLSSPAVPSPENSAKAVINFQFKGVPDALCYSEPFYEEAQAKLCNGVPIGSCSTKIKCDGSVSRRRLLDTADLVIEQTIIYDPSKVSSAEVGRFK